MNRAVITATEAQQKRRHSERPARGAVNLLGPNEQLVPVGGDDHDGIAIEQGSSGHLALVGIVGRDEVRPVGIPSSEPLVVDAGENPLGRRVGLCVTAHDSSIVSRSPEPPLGLSYCRCHGLIWGVEVQDCGYLLPARPRALVLMMLFDRICVVPKVHSRPLAVLQLSSTIA